MRNKIYPCFWMNQSNEEAVALYKRAFPGLILKGNNPLVSMFEIEGFAIMLLNGGDRYRPNPAISISIASESAAEIDHIWNVLAEDAMVLMLLEKYDWSERYGWLSDRFGISWQLMLGNFEDSSQRIATSLMFCGEQQGRATEAIDYYTTLFKNSPKLSRHTYPQEMPDVAGQVMHATFKLDNVLFTAMDSGVPQSFSFTPGNSHVIPCDSQEEIDYFWNAFTSEGYESMCGWCSDKFGVSWQVIPSMLGELMSDPVKGPVVAQALMRMKKLDLEVLKNAGQ